MLINSSNIESTLFKKYYDRGDLPISVDFTGAQRKVVVIYTLIIIIKGFMEIRPYCARLSSLFAYIF